MCFFIRRFLFWSTLKAEKIRITDMNTKTKSNIFVCVTTVAVLCMQISYMHGLIAALKSIILWIVVGYFLADIQIAVIHFEIDNFKPEDNGYKHHLVIAKYGFKYEMLLSHDHLKSHAMPVKDENRSLPDCSPCYPTCAPCYPHSSSSAPEEIDCLVEDADDDEKKDLLHRCNRELSCSPCYPKCAPCYPGSNDDFNGILKGVTGLQQSIFTILGKLDHVFHFSLIANKRIIMIGQWPLLVCMTPLLLYLLSLPPAMSLIYPILRILNEISGSGSPDYYAHHSERAPKYVKLAQQLHLMMTPSDHEKHHKNPRTGYAYFSPITNFVLDNCGFWPLVKMTMEWSKNMKAIPVPMPLIG